MSGVLRRFNEAGIAEFVRRIEVLRTGASASIDDAFVTDDSFTKPIVPEVRLDRPAFKTKREAGEYLSERTLRARESYGDDDPGLWTWLSAWHWDAACPVREDGVRKALAPYHYVYGHARKQRRGQHLLAIAVLLYETAPRSRLLLDTPIYSLSGAVKEVATRLVLRRIAGIFDLMDILYLDPATGRAKRGLVDSRVTRPGDLANRLPVRIRQLEMTYDLVDLNADQLLGLLGDEFRAWANGRTPPRSKVTETEDSEST